MTKKIYSPEWVALQSRISSIRKTAIEDAKRRKLMPPTREEIMQRRRIAMIHAQGIVSVALMLLFMALKFVAHDEANASTVEVMFGVWVFVTFGWNDFWDEFINRP